MILLCKKYNYPINLGEYPAAKLKQDSSCHWTNH